MKELDKKDMKLLLELDVNARATLTNLGKKLRLSKQSVDYRIKKLEKLGLIKGYYSTINFSKLGFVAYRLALKFRNFGIEEEKKLFNYCKSIKKIGWLFSINGRWDVVITIYARDIIEFDKISQKIIYKYGEKILENNISTIVSIYNYPNKFLSKEKINFVIAKDKIETITIDKLDEKILKSLSMDARISLINLSDKIKSNPRTIRYRINRLEKLGIIQNYRAKINTNKLGYDHYKIFLNLQKMTEEKMTSLLGYFKSQKNVIYATRAIGLADLEFEVKIKTPEGLYQIVNNLRNQFKNQIKSWDSVLIREEKMINYCPF